MQTTQDHLRAMRFEYPSAIPIAIGLLPGVWMKYREALTELARAYPVAFGAGAGQEGRDYDALPLAHQVGSYTDHWGCVWSNAVAGSIGVVTGHPAPTREDVWRLQPPDRLEPMQHGFFFLRLCDLRGYEEMMIDFAEEPAELQHLIDLVHAHNLRELDARMATYPDQLMYFGDDLGTQHALPISPATWRTYLKPGYAELYRRARERGFSVYMHTDGHILEIIPDLVEIGVQVINPQVRANGLPGLAAVAKGKVCLDLDLDRQLFPFASATEIEEHIHEVVETLGSPQGGLWLRAEITPDFSLDTIETIARTMERYRYYYAEAAATARA